MKTAMMTTTTAATLLRIRRDSDGGSFESEEDYENTARILNMVDTYPFN